MVAFMGESRADLWFLSNDDLAIRVARTLGITTKSIGRRGSTDDLKEVTWGILAELLLSLATLFGEVRLTGKAELTIAGVWPGRKEEENQEERVQVTSRDGGLMGQLGKRLAVIDQAFGQRNEEG